MSSFVAWFEARALPRPCSLRVCAAFGTEAWMRAPSDCGQGARFTPQQLAVMAVHMLRATLLLPAAVRRQPGEAWRQWAALPEMQEAHAHILRVLRQATDSVDADHDGDGLEFLTYRETAQALIQKIGKAEAVRAAHAVTDSRRHLALARQVAVRLLQLPLPKIVPRNVQGRVPPGGACTTRTVAVDALPVMARTTTW